MSRWKPLSCMRFVQVGLWDGQLHLSPYWNKGHGIQIVDRDYPHERTQACSEIEGHQKPKVQVINPASSFQPIEHIARVEVRRSYQIWKTRETDERRAAVRFVVAVEGKIIDSEKRPRPVGRKSSSVLVTKAG